MLAMRRFSPNLNRSGTRRNLAAVAIVLIGLALAAPVVWLTATPVRGIDATISSRRTEVAAVAADRQALGLLDRLAAYRLGSLPRPQAAAAFERDLASYELALADMRTGRPDDDARSIRPYWNRERRDPNSPLTGTTHQILHLSDVVDEYYGLGYGDADRRTDVVTLFESDLPGAQEELVRATRVVLDSPDGPLSPDRRVEVAGRLSSHFFHRNSGLQNLEVTNRKFGPASAATSLYASAAIAQMAALDAHAATGIPTASR